MVAVLPYSTIWEVVDFFFNIYGDRVTLSLFYGHQSTGYE